MSVLESIGKIVPPPTYIELPSVGVDISDSSLKYIHFRPDKKSGQKLELLYWGDIDIPDGVLQRGTVNDVPKLSAAIKEVKERTGINSIRVSLPEEKAYLFETEIRRGTPQKEIRGQLEFKLEENVPLSPEDAFFDYDIIESAHNSEMLSVSVTVYSRDTINNYYEACMGAGVVPIAFEVEAQAIARASVSEGDKHTHLIVDFGKTRTGIGIVHQGVLMYTSTIDIGGAHLSAALRNSLGDKPENELTEIKNTQGLVSGVNNDGVPEALLPVMNNIANEIKTRIEYWNNKESQAVDRQIATVILCGGSVNMKGLPAFFTDTVGIESKRAEVWQNAFSIDAKVPSIGRRYSYGYATAIGLALAPFN